MKTTLKLQSGMHERYPIYQTMHHPILSIFERVLLGRRVLLDALNHSKRPSYF